MDARLRAVCDLMVPVAREEAGLHEYDGRPQDLSPEGVARALAALPGRPPGRRAEAGEADGRGCPGEPVASDHDEAHLAAFEAALRVSYGEVALHRRNPLPHLANLDLSCYDRRYAPEGERAAARRRHLAGWPDAVDAAVRALDAVPAPVATALLPSARGLSTGLNPDAGAVEARAIRAGTRLVTHLERAAASGDHDAGLGGPALAALMAAGEATTVYLEMLARRAEAERDRLRELLAAACARLRPGEATADTVRWLLADHPDPDGVLAEARATTAEVTAFTAERRLAPYVDGECLVERAPPSRRWATALMSWAAPEEPDGPSWYYVTPPEPSWPPVEQEEWLRVFSRTTLPPITVHEVAPGHFVHGRSLRRAPTLVRRILPSMTFAEGWAHYAEELCLEEGFRAADPRFAVGVAIEALIRVTRLACAIGLHTGAMTVDDATERFVADASQPAPAARREALRATFDPTYGRYTWGKLAILDLRQRARARWGSGYSHLRFATALFELGAPPLGLLDAALDTG